MERKQSQTHQADIQRAKHPVFTGSRNENQKDGRICCHNGFFMFECNTIFTTVQPWVQGERVAVCVFVVQPPTRAFLWSELHLRVGQSLGARRRNVRLHGLSVQHIHPEEQQLDSVLFPRRPDDVIFLSGKTSQTLNFNKSEKCVLIKNVLLMFTSEQRWN